MSAVTPIEPIAPVATAAVDAVSAAGFGAKASDATFAALFKEGLSQVNQSLLAGQADMQRLATGEAQNLHQVMIRLEESRLNFQVMLQVRNRLLEAYQDVMKMQI